MAFSVCIQKKSLRSTFTPEDSGPLAKVSASGNTGTAPALSISASSRRFITAWGRNGLAASCISTLPAPPVAAIYSSPAFADCRRVAPPVTQGGGARPSRAADTRSEEHTSELQSLMRISYAVFCLNKKNKHIHDLRNTVTIHNIN